MHKKELLKIALISLIIATAFMLTGCAKLPPAPGIYQCAWAGDPRAFHCVHSTSGNEIVIQAEDPEMYGAQCMSMCDIQSMSAWVENLKSIAEKKCK